MRMYLSAVYRYPVKSLRGEAARALPIGPRGFLHDRHWMVVDGQGRYLTQRQLARMALIDTRVDDAGRLHLAAEGMPDLAVAAEAGAAARVVVWNDTVAARDSGQGAAEWLSGFLSVECRLVCLGEESQRQVDPVYALPTDQVGFADGFPFLLISQGSLDLLNGKLDVPLPMQRFRPNLVVEGCEPHAEDGWRRIRIGELTFRVAKPCSRCIIPTIDPATAEKSVEPLRTLMDYRRRDNKIYFGQNLLHDAQGRIEVGMPVEIIE